MSSARLIGKEAHVIKEAPMPAPAYLKPKLYGIILVVSALALAGVLLVSRYAAMDLSRDLRTWQDKLNLIADSRATAVSEWVDGNFRELKRVSDNPSLQLYFTELSTLPPEQMASGAANEPAQKTYMRNLLTFTADKMGFVPSNVPLSAQIPAQIPVESSSGIAVIDNNNNIVVSTPYLTAIDPTIAEEIRNLPVNSQALIDIHKNSAGKIQIGFVMPIYSIQADPSSGSQIARIVAIKTLDEALFKLLRHPGTTEKTLETMLIRKDEDNISYLTPLADGSASLDKALTASPAELAEAAVLESPGGFIQSRDYQSRPVLATGRSIPNTSWTLVVKIDRMEALAESQSRRSGMVWMLCMVLAIVVITVIAVWYIASSRRALVSSRFFRDMAERSIAQERMLKLVTDNQPDSLYIIDRQQRYRFVNQHTAKSAEMRPDDMVGKAIGDVVGTARSRETIEACAEALTQYAPQQRIRRLNDEGEEKIVKADFIPLDHIPMPGLPYKTSGVLVVEQDITEVVHEREKRIRSGRQLIDTLVMMVDKRDPNAGNHSMIVSQLAYDVAQAMEMDHTVCDTTRIAGTLMNIGKIVVPTEMLTKRGSLNEDELRSIRDSMFASAELLKDVSFDGPVVETLRQAQERWDGTGPQGLKEEGILISARIIAAVNAFVGMVSPRSYRAALTIESALKMMYEKVDTAFDRKVVAALANYIENLGGRELVQQFFAEKRPAASAAGAA